MENDTNQLKELTISDNKTLNKKENNNGINDKEINKNRNTHFHGISSTNRCTDSWPWVEKYRPSNLNDLIAHEDIRSTLSYLIKSNKLPHLLFYGPPGTGKTSMIMAAARDLYGDNYGSMVLELNASDDRGISIVRNEIKEFAGTKKLYNHTLFTNDTKNNNNNDTSSNHHVNHFNKKIKLVILDEADAMTKDAQNSLRRIIEKYTKNTRFCLIANYYNKIIPAILSRCTKFRFVPLKENQVNNRIREIAELEDIDLTDDGLKALIELGSGDMRKILNILQAASMANNNNNNKKIKITQDNIYLCTGNPLPKDIKKVCDYLLNEDFLTCYNFINNIKKEKGYALIDVVTDVYKFIITFRLPDIVTIYMIKELANLEKRLADNSNENIQMASFISIFIISRSKIKNINNNEKIHAP